MYDNVVSTQLIFQCLPDNLDIVIKLETKDENEHNNNIRTLTSRVKFNQLITQRLFKILTCINKYESTTKVNNNNLYQIYCI